MSNQMHTQSINKFNTFLEKHRIPKDDETTVKTHTSMGGIMGKFSIEDSEYTTFLNLYKTAINAGADLYLVERNREVGPLVIDIDFKTDKKHPTRQYKTRHIKQLIKRYNDLVSELFVVDKSELLSFVFEKDEPTKETKNDGRVEYKDGFHILYPYVPLDVKKRYLVYDIIKKGLEEDNCFEDIPYINEIHELFDSSIIINNGLLMFGCHKPDRTPYKLTRIFNHKMMEEDVEDYTVDDIIEISSLRLYDDDDSFEFNRKSKEYEEIMEKTYEMYTNTKKHKVASKSVSNEKARNDPAYASLTQSTKAKTPQHMENIEMARRLTAILSPKRAVAYDDWIRVGWALHNIDKSLLDAFIMFSKKCPRKYEEGCCEKAWLESKDHGYTIATLYWWAKNDNLEEYKNLMMERVGELIGKAKSGTHDDIANVIKEIYRHVYKCVSIKKKVWYEFQGHRWILVEDGYTLSEKISDEVSKEFLRLQSLYAAKSEEKGHVDADDMIKISRRLMEVYIKLKDVRFKENVMKACAAKFYDKKFEEKLDNNIYLLGFENGVYDFEAKCFRDGMPDDNLTFSVGYDYLEFNKNDKIIKDVKHYFETIQQNAAMRDYVLKLLSTYLVGSAKDQKFIIWTGTGSNGKSLTVELIRKTLGDYFGTMEATVLTQKRKSSSGPTPELANKRGKRFVVIQEPEHNDTVYVGQMKQLTGCDTIETRAMYGDPFTYKPQFKLILTCNRMPQIPSTDGGTWRRVRVTEWATEFVDGIPKAKNQIQKDETLSEKFEDWRQAFVWLLINEIYPRYEKEGLMEPPQVTAHTLKYKKDNDVYLEFLTDHTDDCGPEVKENIDAIFSMFKEWFKKSYSISCPSKKDFVNYLMNKNYKIDRNLVFGLKIRLPGGDDESDDDSDDGEKKNE